MTPVPSGLRTELVEIRLVHQPSYQRRTESEEERQQAAGDPVLSSTPPPVVDLFGGRHVASPCSARR